MVKDSREKWDGNKKQNELTSEARTTKASVDRLESLAQPILRLASMLYLREMEDQVTYVRRFFHH